MWHFYNVLLPTGGNVGSVVEHTVQDGMFLQHGCMPAPPGDDCRNYQKELQGARDKYAVYVCAATDWNK